MKRSDLRAVPAVEKVVRALGVLGLPRPVVVSLVRGELAGLREEKPIPTFDRVVERVRLALGVLSRSRVQSVINGTGILIHTNLGRAPLSVRALRALEEVGAGYSNLEFDLSTGKRGERAAYLEQGLALLCRGEAATVVNNCAAALVLILRHFTARKPKVMISRGELVQIGGGFRIPEILEASGATLREIGTTNKTSLQDYARAVSGEIGLILKVHRSNFFMGGFVESPATEEIARLARQKRIPFVEDLGSGAMVATGAWSRSEAADAPGGRVWEQEPTPAEVLKKGADLVCFSGDKLMGGPQAGIIVGKRKLIAALKREPFFRALRCDKLVLAALQATVEGYLEGEAVPVLELMAADMDVLRGRAGRLIKALNGAAVKAAVGEGRAQVGGGTLPRSSIPSVTLHLVPREGSVEELAARLRRGSPPVVGYVAAKRLTIDLRTVFPSQDDALVKAVRASTAG